ncbi:hypothetical protein EAI_16506 [Harpegnathos saltator]|uniref:Uncharacterized protein n=2 Tax=Harpegnathos saltator TaxID=610380 RepID=E2C5C5_HARSA|nr:hypothetical protein EAI_16506 [Harpegnathos saltator]
MDLDLRKRQRRDRIYDKLHRGFVNTCIGVTLIGGVLLGYKVYEYFVYIRPLHKAQYKVTEENLLDEGRNIEGPSDAEISA